MTRQSQHPDRRSREEMIDWILQYQEHPEDEAIQSLLVRQYEDLVQSLAYKYARGRYIKEDLSQVGMIGLLAALRRFDYRYERSFESFAIPTIIGEMKRFIRDKTWSVHVPRRIKEMTPRIKKAIETLTNDYDRSPTIAEIAWQLQVSEEEVLETMEMGRSYQALSVDSPMSFDDEGSTVKLLDLLPDEESNFETAEQRLLLDDIFTVLTQREKDILRYTYFQSLSQKETGDQLNISQMHVSRLQRKALQKLRHALPAHSDDILHPSS